MRRTKYHQRGTTSLLQSPEAVTTTSTVAVTDKSTKGPESVTINGLHHHHGHGQHPHLVGTPPLFVSSSSSSNHRRQTLFLTLFLVALPKIIIICWLVVAKLEQSEVQERLLRASIKDQNQPAEPAIDAFATKANATTNTSTRNSTSTAASAVTTTDNTSSSSTNKLLPKELVYFSDQLIVTAPVNSSSSTYQDMDKQCTLRRYPYLLGKFCNAVERSSSCDLQAFDAYFASFSVRDRLIAGCPLDEAVCYAKRYNDLFRVHCNESEAKCDYYALRAHYEQNGMKEGRLWGCDLQPIQPATPMVSRQQPAVTVERLPASTKRENVLGKASVQVFQGSWQPVEFNPQTVPSSSICPKVSSSKSRFCNLTARQDYIPAKYVAYGLPEWSARRFIESMNQDGGSGRIAFVGDSLMFQLKSELDCLLEAEAQYSTEKALLYYHATMATFPESVHEQIEVRKHSDDTKKSAFRLKWVDQVIAGKVKYVVYSTGAWWNPHHLWKRGEWCDYDSWEKPTQEEMLTIYAETMKQTLLPIFTMLVEYHHVIPIWVDIPPGGKINLTTGENFDPNFWAGYYKVLPRLNEIGRQMMVDAGGLVLPIWDVSFPRWNDHMLNENFKASDQLHWCAQRHLSVPAVWVQLLAQVLYGNDQETSQTINNITNGTKAAAEPLLRSLQERGAVVQQDVNNEQPSSASKIGHRKLLAEEENPVVSSIAAAAVQRLSSSNQSPCECSNAKVMNHCRANLRCSWNNGTKMCSDRA